MSASFMTHLSRAPGGNRLPRHHVPCPLSRSASLALGQFWPDRLAGLTELRRVLKPGAPFLCSFTPPSGGSTSGLAKGLSAAGFVDIYPLDCPEGEAILARKPA